MNKEKYIRAFCKSLIKKSYNFQNFLIKIYAANFCKQIALYKNAISGGFFVADFKTEFSQNLENFANLTGKKLAKKG